jgi:hypothetical protein
MVAPLSVQHSILTAVDPAADVSAVGDVLADAWEGSESLEGFAQLAQVATSLLVTELLGGVLANLFEVGAGFFAEERARSHAPRPLGGKARL